MSTSCVPVGGVFGHATVKARNNALGGNISKHPKTGRYLLRTRVIFRADG